MNPGLRVTYYLNLNLRNLIFFIFFEKNEYFTYILTKIPKNILVRIFTQRSKIILNDLPYFRLTLSYDRIPFLEFILYLVILMETDAFVLITRNKVKNSFFQKVQKIMFFKFRFKYYLL